MAVRPHRPESLYRLSCGFVLLLACAVALGCSGPGVERRPRSDGGLPSERPPNVVFIMADELGYFELSSLGHPNLQTPNIDRLAAGGLRMRQVLAGSSVCAPTRATLMTGKHSGHTSVRSNGGGTPLRADEETVATVLKRAGYATGGFGKWGCGGRGSTGVPEDHGFDVFFGYYDQVHAHTYFPSYLIRNSEEVELPGNRGGRLGETYAHYAIVDEAKQFIRDNHTRPFFCYLPVTPPHGMFDIPESDPSWALFRDKPWPREAKRYAAMVHLLDRNVGEIVRLLDDLSLRENTVVFFCGDNGGVNYFADADHPRGFHAPNVNPRTGQEFRGHKGNLYEGGLRIPMIVNWPGVIAPGRTSDHLGYFPDVLPTLSDLAGVKPPVDVDGLSWVPTILDRGRQRQHEALYWELGGQVAVRERNWKAVLPGRGRDWELYDLDRDLGERNDLAVSHPETLDRLITFATAAHTPVREGLFHDRSLHEKDRLAKGMPRRNRRVNSLPTEGLLDSSDWTVVSASSESVFNGKRANHAFDRDPRTLWHTKWRGGAEAHPHELIIDLGAVRTIRGFRYLARQDNGWNGTLRRCDFYVAETAERFESPIVTATFEKTKAAQSVSCEPVRGRFIKLVTRTAQDDGLWASVAELGVVGE